MIQKRVTLSPASDHLEEDVHGCRVEPTSFLSTLCKEQSVTQPLLDHLQSELRVMEAKGEKTIDAKIIRDFLKAYCLNPGFYDPYLCENGETFTAFATTSEVESFYVDCEYAEVASTKIDPTKSYSTKFTTIYYPMPIHYVFCGTWYTFTPTLKKCFKFLDNGHSDGWYDRMHDWCINNRHEAIRMLGWAGVWHEGKLKHESETDWRPRIGRDRPLER